MDIDYFAHHYCIYELVNYWDPNATIIKATVVAAWHAALFVSITIIVFTPFYFIRSGFTAKLFSFTMLLVCAMLMVQLLANSGIINNFIIGEHVSVAVALKNGHRNGNSIVYVSNSILFLCYHCNMYVYSSLTAWLLPIMID